MVIIYHQCEGIWRLGESIARRRLLSGGTGDRLFLRVAKTYADSGLSRAAMTWRKRRVTQARNIICLVRRQSTHEAKSIVIM